MQASVPAWYGWRQPQRLKEGHVSDCASRLQKYAWRHEKSGREAGQSVELVLRRLGAVR